MNDFENINKEKTVIRRAEIPDIPSIRRLIENSLGDNLSEKEKEKEGFVTWNPTENELAEIINDSGIVVSISGEKLKGYAITMSREAGHRNPFFAEMLSQAEKMEFDGKLIADYNYVIFAQICIDKSFRGGMTFVRLHSATQEILKEQNYEIFVGEIADTNRKSLAVHSNYTDIGTYDSERGIKWHVIVGDLREE
jgi:hypothetical protein